MTGRQFSKGENQYGGFKLEDDGSRYNTSYQQLKLLYVIEDCQFEPLTVYELFFWDNMNHEQFRYLMSKTFKLEFIILYRDVKGNLILRFEEKEVSLRVKKNWKFTWPEFVSLVKELIG